jgi:hypothetical protein
MGRPSIGQKTTKPGPLARTGCTGRLGVDRMHAQGWLDIAKASPVVGQGATMPPAKVRPHRPSPRPWPINPPVGIVTQVKAYGALTGTMVLVRVWGTQYDTHTAPHLL